MGYASREKKDHSEEVNNLTQKLFSEIEEYYHDLNNADYRHRSQAARKGILDDVKKIQEMNNPKASWSTRNFNFKEALDIALTRLHVTANHIQGHDGIIPQIEWINEIKKCHSIEELEKKIGPDVLYALTDQVLGLSHDAQKYKNLVWDTCKTFALDAVIRHESKDKTNIDTLVKQASNRLHTEIDRLRSALYGDLGKLVEDKQVSYMDDITERLQNVINAHFKQKSVAVG